jgi:hypothetical protein
MVKVNGNFSLSTPRRHVGWVKADSHIACRATEGLECVFPIWFTQCSHVWFTLAMPWPCRSSRGNGTARPSRDDLWATCPRSASSSYRVEFHEDCYQQHTSLRCRWPVWNQTTFVMDEEKSGSSTLQKKTICYTVELAVRIFLATMRTFTKDTALSEHGRGTAWRVWINSLIWQGNGMGTACCVWIVLLGIAPPTLNPQH